MLHPRLIKRFVFARIFNISLVHLVSVSEHELPNSRPAWRLLSSLRKSRGGASCSRDRTSASAPFSRSAIWEPHLASAPVRAPFARGQRSAAAVASPHTLGGVATIRACPMKSPSRQRRARQLHCLTADKLSRTLTVLGSVERTGNKNKKVKEKVDEETKLFEKKKSRRGGRWQPQPMELLRQPGPLALPRPEPGLILGASPPA